VIGHSHGRNVALRALASPDLTNVRAICLSTPILQAVARSALTESDKFLWLIFALPFLGTVFTFVGLSSFGAGEHWFSKKILGLDPGGLVFPIVALISYLIWRALVAYRDCAKQVAKAIELPDDQGDRVLFLRFVGDEASLAPTTFQAL
jgi:hypothetical protein